MPASHLLLHTFAVVLSVTQSFWCLVCIHSLNSISYFLAIVCIGSGWSVDDIVNRSVLGRRDVCVVEQQIFATFCREGYSCSACVLVWMHNTAPVLKCLFTKYLLIYDATMYILDRSLMMDWSEELRKPRKGCLGLPLSLLFCLFVC